MEIKKILNVVGQQVSALQGNETKDTTFASEHTYPDEQMAAEAFIRSKAKLFAVDDWSNLPGLTSTFRLHDKMGRPKGGQEVLVGDYISIDLPVPGPVLENWVRITDIRTGDTEAQFTVVPSENPKPEKTSETAPVEHFFTDEASSTFRVERQGNRLIAAELGRNERINNDEAKAGDRSIVNTLVAAGGWAYFQEVQWKKLTDYLVHL